MQIFKNPNFDFVRWRWHALALSCASSFCAGVFVIATRGMPKGVEFSGGTIVILKFDQTPDLEPDHRGASAATPSCSSYGAAARTATS